MGKAGFGRLRSRVAVAVAILGLSVCGGKPAAAADPAPVSGFRLAEPADFSALGFVEAFRSAHRKFATEYAFTRWKNVDWRALYRRTLPAVEDAARSRDEAAYFRALTAYVAGIDDGHVSLPRNNATAPLVDAAVRRQSGGSFGLGLAMLDDGRVIVAKVAPGGPAEKVGVEPGAVVLEWDGLPVSQAVRRLDLGAHVAAMRVATDEYRRLEQVRLLTRAPVGASARLVYRSPAAAAVRAVRLVAVDDDLRGLDLFNLAPPPTAEDERAIIAARRIGDDGYIRLSALADLKDLKRAPDFIWDSYAAAVEGFNRAGVHGLVLDLRGNHGGYDVLAEMICGSLYDRPAFYEATVFFDAATGRFRRITVDDRTGKVVDALMIEPQPPHFRGPVAVLVNPRTISSAEGIAHCIAARPNGAVIGFHGTRGSFGLAGGEATLPGGITLHYPFGRAVDRRGVVMIDSRNGRGGVAPTVRVLSTRENILAFASGDDVELERALHWLRESR